MIKKHTYAISLTKKKVDIAKKELQKGGGKLSTLLDHLLGKWIESREK